MARTLSVSVTLGIPLPECEAIEAAARSAGLSRAAWCKRALHAALPQSAFSVGDNLTELAELAELNQLGVDR